MQFISITRLETLELLFNYICNGFTVVRDKHLPTTRTAANHFHELREHCEMTLGIIDRHEEDRFNLHFPLRVIHTTKTHRSLESANRYSTVQDANRITVRQRDRPCAQVKTGWEGTLARNSSFSVFRGSAAVLHERRT